MKYTRGDTVVAFEKLWFLQKRHAARYASAQREAPWDQEPSHSLLELSVKPILALLEQHSASSDSSFFRSYPGPSARETRECWVQQLVFADAQNYTNPADFIERNFFLFTPPSVAILTDSVPALKLHKIPLQFLDTVSPATIADLCRKLQDIPDYLWSEETMQMYSGAILEKAVNLTMEKSSADLPTGEALNEMLLSLEKAWLKLIRQYLRWALVAGKPGPDIFLAMRILGFEETCRRLTAAAELLKSLNSDEADRKREKL